MLSPDGDGNCDPLEASLERAFTSIRPTRLAWFKPALSALRSASVRAAARAASRFWRGLEQTTLVGVRTHPQSFLSPRGVMSRAEQGKNIPRGGEGAHKLMRRSNKVKKILLKKSMKSSVLGGEPANG